MSRELATFRKPEDRFRILMRINAILAELDQMSADYVSNDISEQFRIGSAAALADLQKLNLPDLDASFTGFHREAVKQLADDARLRFAAGIEGARRDATLRLSEATKKAILQEMLVKQMQGGLNPTKAVEDIFKSKGITAIQTRTGRRGLEDYVDTLVRSISTEAHNAGAVARYVENDVNYGQVIERETACKICRPMNGKIIWLGDPRLRPGYHPRCEGGIAPVIGNVDNPIRSPDDPRIPQVTRDAMLRK